MSYRSPKRLAIALVATFVGPIGSASCSPKQPATNGADSTDSRHANPSRGRLSHLLTSDWRFVRAPTANAEALDLDDSEWDAIDLPHTWNAVDGQDGGNDYYRGIGWYRKWFFISATAAPRRFFIEFDGANIVADVYVNGNSVGTHHGGYSRFRFDVTRHINVGAKNLFAVKVDNSETTDVAPLTGADFTYYGGIYRDVRLIETNPLHIDALNAGGPGVYLVQRRVSRDLADIEVRARVTNDQDVATTAEVEYVVRDASGVLVQRGSRSAEIQARATVVVSQSLSITKPRLWNGLAAGDDAVDPHLYRVHIKVRDRGGDVTDSVEQPLGLRFFDIDPKRGFSLNGGPYVQLRGVGLHQDWKGVGPATSAEQRRENFALIEELGCNAIRLAHYQHPPDAYAEADRRGFLLWTELPVINRIDAGAALTANARQQLTELILQNFNHPSVLMWGITNEPLMHKGPDPLPLLRQLNELAHQLDASRPTVLASHMAQEAGPTTHPSHEISDVLGFNGYYGWYYQSLDDLEPWIENYRKNHPGRAISLSEFGAGAATDRPSATPKPKDLSEEYQTLFLDHHLGVAANAELWGAFIWLFADFGADHRDDGFRPGINDKGVVTYDRKVKKDGFYVVKAHWSAEPTLRIASRRFALRRQQTIDIAVITNIDRVELRLNGVPLAAPETSPKSRLRWWRGVVLVPGENRVEAAAQTADGKRIVDRAVWKYHE